MKRKDKKMMDQAGEDGSPAKKRMKTIPAVLKKESQKRTTTHSLHTAHNEFSPNISSSIV